MGDNGDRGAAGRGRGGSRAHDRGGDGGAGGNGSNTGRGGGGSSGGGGLHLRGRAVGHSGSARGDGDLLSGVDSGLGVVPSGGQAGEKGNGSGSETHCDCYENEPEGLVLKVVCGVKSVAFCRKRVSSWLERVEDRSRESD